MSKLHELLAVMGDTASAAHAILSETENTFLKKPDHFKGQTRSVTFFDESRAGENVSETKELVTTIYDKLDHTLGVVGRHYDALLQQESANQEATADLVVNGKTIATNLPATFLLGMETRLKSLREVLLKTPTLEPAIKWTQDEATGANVFISDPQYNFRTEKEIRHKVLYDATDKHPAQIQQWTEDKPVARIETVHRSGMISPAAKSRMISRLDMMISAVKKARQRANLVEVPDRRIAQEMFDFLLG